jgi:2-dehydropantoate 2-reductase
MDWILLCTKAHQIASAAHWLRHLIGPDTRVAVMQNGVDHIGRASRRDRCTIRLIKGDAAIFVG